MLKARKVVIACGTSRPIACQRDGNGARCGSIGHEITIATAHQAVIAKATVKRIGAITAKQRIGRSITKQAIGTRAADHMFKARQAIIARRTTCPIGHQINDDGATACGIGQNIVMRVTNKRIVTKAAIQGIRAIIAIQRIIAARASAAPSPDPYIRTAPLDEVVARADHLVLAAPITPATQHLLNAERLARMKATAHIVNVGRGGLIDQDALLSALDAGAIARATLDVTDPEPLPAGHPLYAHPKVRISPHTSAISSHIREALIAKVKRNLARFEAGQDPEDLIRGGPD